jgi:hypothetical protein
MFALKDNTTPSRPEQVADPVHPARNLASAWAQGRRRITPWAYPYLGALAAVRITVGLFLVGLGATFLSHSHGVDAAIVLVGAALTLSIGLLDGNAARSAPPRA